jgi:hypothetical protein
MTALEFVRLWNASWNCDYWWRKKYNVAFNSPEHRAMDPIDIHIDYIENELAEEYAERSRKERENKPFLDKGEWIKDNKDRSVVDIVWDKIDLNDF